MDLTVHGALLNNITASFGLSVFPDDANELEALITAADLALYKSKKSGRNRLTIYDIELAQPPV
jgi:diguanylate cyclase (GGDEF)-like protein